MGWKGVPVDDCLSEKCELVVDFQGSDLSVCKRMIPCRGTSVLDQVVRGRLA